MEGIDLHENKINVSQSILIILTVFFFIILGTLAFAADGVILVDPSTIAVTKTTNSKSKDAQTELFRLGNQSKAFRQKANDASAQQAEVDAKINEILTQFQSVGIDLIDPR